MNKSARPLPPSGYQTQVDAVSAQPHAVQSQTPAQPHAVQPQTPAQPRAMQPQASVDQPMVLQAGMPLAESAFSQNPYQEMYSAQPVFASTNPVQPAPSKSYTASAAPVQPMPGSPAQSVPLPPAFSSPIPAGGRPNPTRSDSSEAFLGGKVVGVIAVLLVLSGLVLLGATFIPQLPDIAKAGFIYAFALALTAGGAFLVTRSRNVFTYALFVCGTAAFFVAIWASWMHFGLFTHASALVASGAWMAVTVVLLVLTRTWSLSIALSVAAGLFGTVFLEGEAKGRFGSYSLMDSFAFDPYYAAAFILLALYIVALAIVGIKLALDTAVPDGSNVFMVRRKVLASVFVSEAALFLAGLSSTWMLSESVMVVVLGVCLLAIRLAPMPTVLYHGQTAWRVNEIVVLFLAAVGFLGAAKDPEIHATIAYGVFTVAALVLAGLRIADRAKADYQPTHPSIPMLFALVLSGVVVNYVCGVAFPEASSYMWSALGMVCALVAIALGFRFGEKPLRLYGLVMALLCILKIAIFDLSGDRLAHAVALVVAGLVCFGISALYTYASKRLS